MSDGALPTKGLMMNNTEFDMESEFMEKIEDFVRVETENAREKMQKTLQRRLAETNEDVTKQLATLRSEILGQVSEANLTIGAVKSE